jgi:MFS family permease
VGPEWQGRVLGLLQSVASLARIAGPVAGGWLLEYDARNSTGKFGRTPFWTGGAVMLVAFALALTIQPSRSEASHNTVGLESSD